MPDCLFCKIIAREIPASIVYEDDRVLAFDDIKPQGPAHVLVVPKHHIATLNDLTPDDDPIVGELVRRAAAAPARPWPRRERRLLRARRPLSAPPPPLSRPPPPRLRMADAARARRLRARADAVRFFRMEDAGTQLRLARPDGDRQLHAD